MTHARAVRFLWIPLLLTACNWGKVESLEKERDMLRQENSKLVGRMEEREQRIVESFDALNEIYADLAAVDEELVAIKPAEGTAEGKFDAVTEATKQHIENIRLALEERKQRIADLTKRNEKLGIKIAGLNKRIQTLAKAVEEKQAEIVALQAEIGALNETVAAQGATIATQAETIVARDTTIRKHEDKLAKLQDALDKVWYVVGREDDLTQRGLVRETGGFLFGWGAVPVLAHPIDDNQFVPLTVYASEIGVPGPIAALVPARGETTYRIEQTPGGSRIVILDAPAFWQEKHLAILLE